MKVFPFFRHCLKDLDKIMMPKWDVKEAAQAWRYVTGIKVHLTKNMTIQITVAAANLRHHQYNQPILDNYRDLIAQDIASSYEMVPVEEDTSSSEDEPEPTQEPNEDPSEAPCSPCCPGSPGSPDLD